MKLPSAAAGSPAVWFTAVCLLLAGLALFAWHVVLSWPFTVDDAFIVLRYARNLATHGELTMNVGLPPVEGASQTLWVALMAIPHLLGVDAGVVAKATGIGLMLLALLGVAVLTNRLARYANAPDAARQLATAVAPMSLAVMPPTAVHAVSGLCTALFTCLATWLFVGCARLLLRPQSGGRWRLAALGLLLGLCRPEGNLVAGGALLVTGCLLPAGQRRAFARAVLLGYLLPGLVWFAVRFTYYGLPLPLPIYVKLAPAGSFGTHEDGAAVLLRVWQQWALPMLLAAVPGVLWWRRALLPASAAAAILLVAAGLPSQIMGYCWRYSFAALSVLAAVGALGCGAVGALAARLPWPFLQATAAAVLPIVLAIVASNAASDEAKSLRSSYATGLQRAHQALGDFLAAQAPTGRPGLLAIGDAGTVPYLSSWRTIDTFGLNNPVVARTGVHDAASVLAQQPDVLVLISKSPWHFVPWLPYESRLHEQALVAGMVKAQVLRFHDEYFLWVLARDGQLAAALRNWSPPSAVPDPFAGEKVPGIAVQPLGLSYGDLELVDAVLFEQHLGLRTRGSWRSEEHVVVLTLLANDDARPTRCDCRPATWLGSPPPTSEWRHWLPLPRALRPGDIVRVGVIQGMSPHGPLSAADGRDSAELR
jgi:arabinofuranosyltransferase